MIALKILDLRSPHPRIGNPRMNQQHCRPVADHLMRIRHARSLPAQPPDRKCITSTDYSVKSVEKARSLADSSSVRRVVRASWTEV